MRLICDLPASGNRDEWRRMPGRTKAFFTLLLQTCCNKNHFQVRRLAACPVPLGVLSSILLSWFRGGLRVLPLSWPWLSWRLAAPILGPVWEEEFQAR